MTVPFTSVAQAQQRAPETLAEHVSRSTELHHQDEMLMAGAFLQADPDDGYLRIMAICRTKEAAERFMAGDPFVRNGTALRHRIRAWANTFAR